MSTETISNAILQFSTNNVYPEAENIITAELNPATTASVLDALHKERDELKQEIRSLDRTTGPDVQSWIDQAKSLQNDIQKSRDIARQIIEEHEDGSKIEAQVSDARSKIEFLEKEVTFESALEETLRQIKESNNLLLAAQNAIVEGDLSQAYERLGTARSSIIQLNAIRDTRAVSLLRDRGKQLQSNLDEALTARWNALLLIDLKTHQLTIGGHNHDTTIQTVAEIAQNISILERLTHKLGRDIERALLKPLLSHGDEIRSFESVISANSINLQLCQTETTSETLFTSLVRALDFLSAHLPQSVLRLLLERLVPNILSQLEEFWLEPSIPTEITRMKAFEGSIITVEHFAAHLNKINADGRPLEDWINNLPKAWLTKRREVLLSEVRNLVFQGLTETKIVERVESQMIDKDDALAAQVDGGDEDWDTAWDEGSVQQESPTITSTRAKIDQPVTEDDDGSAWDVDESSDVPATTDTAEDAWGWGDDENHIQEKANEAKSSSATTNQPSFKPTQRELTFRETYTVTAVPDGILQAVRNVVSDAQTLATDDYSSSTFAPAVVGLYSLPTLALAIYRATAPTAYAKLRTGNMLIYNDATRLSERLRDWQSSQPPASRLRLDNDAKALDLFAKRAYGTEMDSQKTVLRDLLDGAQGFSNCTASPFKEACESAVEQTADRLQDVHREWKDVLGHNALLQSLGQLLSGVTGKVIADIEDLSDIGEADSGQLKALCERLSVVKTLFTQQQADGELRDMTFVYCPNWLKFQYLAEIMESSLADIKYLWNEGELSLEFSSEEVIDLIKALFAESDHRRKLIGDLRRQSRR